MIIRIIKINKILTAAVPSYIFNFASSLLYSHDLVCVFMYHSSSMLPFFITVREIHYYSTMNNSMTFCQFVGVSENIHS